MNYDMGSFESLTKNTASKNASLINAKRVIKHTVNTIVKMYPDTLLNKKGNNFITLLTNEKTATAFQLFGIQSVTFGTDLHDGHYFVCMSIPNDRPDDWYVTTFCNNFIENMKQETRMDMRNTEYSSTAFMYTERWQMAGLIVLLYGLCIEKDDKVWEKLTAHQKERDGNGLKTWIELNSSKAVQQKKSETPPNVKLKTKSTK